jgi:hypothetical protein
MVVLSQIYRARTMKPAELSLGRGWSAGVQAFLDLQIPSFLLGW